MSAIEIQWHLREHCTISVPEQLTPIAFALWPVCARGAPVALQETLLCYYGNLTATLLRSYQSTEWLFSFVHAQGACHLLAFYAIPTHLMEMSLRSCGNACDPSVGTSAFHFFSEALGSQWEGSRSVTGVLHGNIRSLFYLLKPTNATSSLAQAVKPLEIFY